MGYHSRCRGEITFEPPLSWPEIRDNEFLAEKDYHYDDIYIKVAESETQTETEAGVVVTIRRLGLALTTPEGDEQRFHGLADQMKRFATQIDLSNGRAKGAIVRVGDESGDVQRYYFTEAGEFKSDQAQLFWPDGTKVLYTDHCQ